MMRFISPAFAAIALAPSASAQLPLPRDWIGELRIGDRHSLVELALGDKQASGTIAYPVAGTKPIALTTVSTSDEHVSFSWPDDQHQVSFGGEVVAGILSGSIQSDTGAGTLQLAPVAKLSESAIERIAGYYELSPGHLIAVTPFPYGPVFTDYTSGRAGVLFASSETEFFVGPAFQVPLPITIRAEFVSDNQGKITGVRWQEGGSAALLGRKLDFRREEVMFKNGDVVLSGTLVLPAGNGKHPAIIVITGSGATTRRNWADGWYAYHGIAYLSYDKRGAGKSTGDWREAGLSELADDVLAGIRFLRERSDIDGNRINLQAVSEGGWVAPVVASRDPKMRSIIVINGPALDYVSELMNEVEEGSKARGLAGEDLKQALEFKGQALAMIKNGAGLNDEAWEKFQAFVRPYRSEKWFRYVAEPEKRGWPQKKLYLMSQVDTVALWRHIRIPVLALYGGHDLNVPAAKNVLALSQALKTAGNRDYTIRVFPKANHDGLETGKALLTDDELRYLQGSPQGYYSTQLEWTLNHNK